MSRRSVYFAAMLVMAAPAAFAQHRASSEGGDPLTIQARQEQLNRQALSNSIDTEQANRQAWLNSLTNVTKLRAKLAGAWQALGLPAQQAKLIADAYDPELATQMHHTSVRGKSDQEVAHMMQAALTDKHYLAANQLMIDYQREKLRLGAPTAPPGVR